MRKRPPVLIAALALVAGSQAVLAAAASAAPGDPYTSLAVTSFSWHKTDPGELEVVAEIKNNGSVTAEGIELDVNYETKAGQVLGTGSGLTDPTRLAPGERTTIAIDDDMPSGTQVVVVTNLSGVESGGPARRGFVVSGLSSVVESDGDTHYVGTVTNTSDAPAENVGVFVSLFNAQGIAVGELGTEPTQSDGSNPGVLLANQSLSFDADDDGTNRPAVASEKVLVDALGGQYPATPTGPITPITTGVPGTTGGTGVGGVDSGATPGTTVQTTAGGSATIGAITAVAHQKRKKVGLKIGTKAAKVKHGKVFEVDTALTAKLRGVAVYLQRWSGKAYVTVARTHSNSAGKAAFKVRFGKGSVILRAVFPGTASYVGASSKRIVERVL